MRPFKPLIDLMQLAVSPDTVCRQPGRPRPLRQCFFAMGADNASTVSGSQMGGAYPREAWHTPWAPTAARQPVAVTKRSAKRLSFSTQRVTTRGPSRPAPGSVARLLPWLRLRRSQPPRSASTAAAHRQGGGAGSTRARTPEKADTRPRSASRAVLGALRARRVQRQSGAERAPGPKERVEVCK